MITLTYHTMTNLLLLALILSVLIWGYCSNKGALYRWRILLLQPYGRGYVLDPDTGYLRAGTPQEMSDAGFFQAQPLGFPPNSWLLYDVDRFRPVPQPQSRGAVIGLWMFVTLFAGYLAHDLATHQWISAIIFGISTGMADYLLIRHMSAKHAQKMRQGAK